MNADLSVYVHVCTQITLSLGCSIADVERICASIDFFHAQHSADIGIAIHRYHQSMRQTCVCKDDV